MPPAESGRLALRESVAGLGRGSQAVVAFAGSGARLLWQCGSWILLGHRRGQPVRPASALAQMWEVGIGALPIVSLLAFTIGIMLAIQGIEALRPFGAEHQLVIGVSLSVAREFGPLITAILVAGRSGSALAARLATMRISNELDALETMGINPVRFLVAPSLVAMLVMLPLLTVWADLLGLFGAGLYASAELGSSLGVWAQRTLSVLAPGDVLHGLAKSALFALLIVVVGVLNGLGVQGGAEGVGRVTTRSVVHAISAIVLTDMIFAFATTRT